MLPREAVIPLAEPAPGLPGAFFAAVPLAPEVDPTLLTPQERSLFEQLPGAGHRRREWAAGRLAGRAALRASGAGAASILRDDNGAPRLVGPHADEVHLAITHGKRLAAAIATRRDGPWPTVGIDLVDAEDQARIERIAERFLKPCEHGLIAAEARAAMIVWGAREAVAKATRTGMFLFALSAVWVESIETETGRISVNVPGMHLGYTALADGGVLVFAGASPVALAHAASHVALAGRVRG
jgi:4'-phosphopantetheinyl transferase EntD